MGLIARYRERLPFAPGDPVVSLEEGSTPLGLAERMQYAAASQLGHGRRAGVLRESCGCVQSAQGKAVVALLPIQVRQEPERIETPPAGFLGGCFAEQRDGCVITALFHQCQRVRGGIRMARHHNDQRDKKRGDPTRGHSLA